MPVYPKPLYVEAGTYVSRADTINPTLCCEFYLKQSFILEELYIHICIYLSVYVLEAMSSHLHF